jgi:hypothetical protein
MTMSHILATMLLTGFAGLSTYGETQQWIVFH